MPKVRYSDFNIVTACVPGCIHSHTCKNREALKMVANQLMIISEKTEPIPGLEVDVEVKCMNYEEREK